MKFRTYGKLKMVCNVWTKTVHSKILWRVTQVTALWCIILNAIANHGWGLIGI